MSGQKGTGSYNNYLNTMSLERERSNAIAMAKIEEKQKQAEADAISREIERKNNLAIRSAQTVSISEQPGLAEERYKTAEAQALRGLNKDTLTPKNNESGIW